MTILDRLLDELRAAKGPISSVELARRLEVSPSALDGMVSVLVSTGRLAGGLAQGDAVDCAGLACGRNCVGLDECAFVVAVPVTVSPVRTPADRSRWYARTA